MKLSVVIPIYNVRATLDRCVASVVGQDYAPMEVILVDDGSTDGSGALADAWVEKVDNVRVIHKANGGLSDARNAGIAIATGELITFVDSDDYIAPHTYTSVVSELADDVDIIEYSAILFEGDPTQEGRLCLSCHTYTDKEEYWLKGKAYAHTYAWNKIYRRSLFSEVRFPKGKVFEDVYTLPLLLAQARKVQTTPQGLYHYTFNPHGITATATGDKLLMLLEAHTANIDYWKDDEYYLRLLNIQLDVCRLTGAKPILKKRRVGKLKGLDRRLLIKALLLNLFGLDLLCWIYKIKNN